MKGPSTKMQPLEHQQLEEPDYDYLDGSFIVDERDDLSSTANGEHQQAYLQNNYILGTLLVRVKSARGIELPDTPAGTPLSAVVARGGGGLGFRSRDNDFCLTAELSFLGQVQSTSQIVCHSDHATWPRNEEFFFDLNHPWFPEMIKHDGVSSDGGHNGNSEGDNNNDNVEGGNDLGPPLYSKGFDIPPPPVMSLCLFLSERPASSNVGKKKKKKGGSADNLYQSPYDNKKQQQQSSPPELVGLCSIDFLSLVTGQMKNFDQWVPLFGGDSSAGEILITAEYTPSDPKPRPGDLCRLTGFCSREDVFPVPLDLAVPFVVDDVAGEFVYLSYTTSEGWISVFGVHRFMIITLKRQKALIEKYQEQISDITVRLKCSPLMTNVVEKYDSIPTDGLVGVGRTVVTESFGLFSRWMQGGVDKIVEDVVDATNWDGKHTPSVFTQGSSSFEDEDDDSSDDDDEDDFIEGAKGSKRDLEGPDELLGKEALPGMPQCPITGQPMRDPVVAGDGHTYERSAITRWMETSEISPLTGAKFPHKGLAPNYLLISSISSSASAAAAAAATSPIRHISTDGTNDGIISDGLEAFATTNVTEPDGIWDTHVNGPDGDSTKAFASQMTRNERGDEAPIKMLDIPDGLEGFSATGDNHELSAELDNYESEGGADESYNAGTKASFEKIAASGNSENSIRNHTTTTERPDSPLSSQAPTDQSFVEEDSVAEEFHHEFDDDVAFEHDFVE